MGGNGAERDRHASLGPDVVSLFIVEGETSLPGVTWVGDKGGVILGARDVSSSGPRGTCIFGHIVSRGLETGRWQGVSGAEEGSLGPI